MIINKRAAIKLAGGVLSTALLLSGTSAFAAPVLNVQFINTGSGGAYTGSQLFDNGNLHIATDDYLFLDAPVLTKVSGALGVMNGVDIYKGSVTATGSHIYDDNNLHILTDDHLYLDAPVAVHVSNNLIVGGTITGNLTGNVTGNVSGSAASFTGSLVGDVTGTQGATVVSNVSDSALSSNVALLDANNTFTGSSLTLNNASRHALLHLANDGDLNVEGNTTLGSSHWDNLTVNATTTFENDVTVNGDLTASNLFTTTTGVVGDFEVGGALTVDNGITMDAASRHAVLHLANDGDLNVEGNTTLGSSHWDNLTVNATTTFENDATVNGDLTANGNATFTNGLTSEAGITMDAVSRHALLDLANDGDLQVDGNTTLGSSHWDNLTVNATTNFENNVSTNGDLTANGDATFTNGLTANDGITMDAASRHALLDLANDGDLNVEGNTTLGSSHWDNLTVNATSTFENGASFNDGLTSYNGITMDADYRHALLHLANDGDLQVDGNATMGSSHWDNLTVNATATFENNATFNSGLTSNDNVTMDAGYRHALLHLANDGDLNVEGNTTLGSSHWDNLTVNATTTFENDVTVNGDATFTNGLTANNGITMDAGYRHAVLDLANDGDLNVEGNTTLGSSHWDNLTVNATSTFENNVSTNGDLTANGNAYFEDGLTSYNGITMDASYRHALLNLANDGDLNVEGNTTLGSSHWDNLTVNADATFENGLTGNLTGNADTATSATSATSATTSTDFSGSLSGDVTGTQGATVVSHVNADNIDSGTLSDARLSGNVALLNAISNHFTGNLVVDGTISGTFTGDFNGTDVTVGGVLSLGTQTYTLADNGGGTAASGVLTPTKSYVEVDCQDPDGCNVNLGETMASQGDMVVILNKGTNYALNIADSPNVTELNTNFSGTANSTLTLIYDGNAWVELSRSNN